MKNKCNISDEAAPPLTHDQFQRELNYRAALSLCRRMLEDGLIARREAVHIEQILIQRFSPVWGGLYQSIR